MRRNIKIILPVIAIALLSGSFMPAGIAHCPVKNVQTFRNYTWYMDPDYTDPTGTISDINVEIYRLQNLFGSNIFSSTPSMGLHEYEYGYYPYTFPAIIYSDL